MSDITLDLKHAIVKIESATMTIESSKQVMEQIEALFKYASEENKVPLKIIFTEDSIFSRKQFTLNIELGDVHYH